MKEFTYLKTWNSQSKVDDMWNKLTISQQKKLKKIIDKLEKNLLSFSENKDNAYSLILHTLTYKIDIIEKEVIVKKLVPIHNTPFEKMAAIDNTTIGEIKW